MLRIVGTCVVRMGEAEGDEEVGREVSRAVNAWRRERRVGAGLGSGGTMVVVVGILVRVKSRFAGLLRRVDIDLGRPGDPVGVVKITLPDATSFSSVPDAGVISVCVAEDTLVEDRCESEL